MSTATELQEAFRAGLRGEYEHDGFTGSLLDGLAGLRRDSPEATTAALVGAGEALSELAERIAGETSGEETLISPALRDRHPDADPELLATYRIAFRTTWDRARTLFLEYEPEPEVAAGALRGVASACCLAGQRMTDQPGDE